MSAPGFRQAQQLKTLAGRYPDVWRQLEHSTLFVLPLYCAIYYCAFREIYLGRTENKPEAAKKRSSIPTKAVGSQV